MSRLQVTVYYFLTDSQLNDFSHSNFNPYRYSIAVQNLNVAFKPLYAGHQMRVGKEISQIFGLYLAVSPKQCKIGRRLLLKTNRKSHTDIQLVLKSMTLNDRTTIARHIALCVCFRGYTMEV